MIVTSFVTPSIFKSTILKVRGAIADATTYGQYWVGSADHVPDIHVVPEVEGAIVIPLAWYWVVAIYVAVAVATSYIAASLARHMNSGSNGPGGPQSTMFNGPQNSTDQGGPIPIIYGKQCLVGSTVMATDTDYFNIA